MASGLGLCTPHNLSSHLEGPIKPIIGWNRLLVSRRFAPFPSLSPYASLPTANTCTTASQHACIAALQGQQVSNHDLWDSLRSLMRSRSGETLWKHVYSHVGIEGNERADALANLGQLQHPGRLQFLRDLRAR